MEKLFSNKVVVVTGGTEGIGKALVAQFLSYGAKVATCARTEEKLNQLQAECSNPNLLTIPVDVSNEKDCERLILATLEKFSKIDILINNAGISMRGLFQDTSIETLKKVMDINFWGSVYCTKYALDSILKEKGSIVAISSIAGYRGLPGRSGYSASKFALQGWMEALRTELLDSGVNVMWVCPGFTKSNIRKTALNEKAESHGESPIDEEKIMTADECASHITKAIIKRNRTLVLTFTGKRTVFMNKFFPALTDRLTKNFFFQNGELKR